MIVLHAAPLAEEFFIWAEATAPTGGKTSRRGPRAPAPPALPFGAGKDDLLAAVADILPGVRADGQAAETRIVWLPGARGQALASTPLIASPPENGAPMVLGPWRVAVLRVEAPMLLDLLAATLDKKFIAPGLTIGADWSFWANALRFASALATRQQMLPGLTRRDRRWRACWEAVFAGVDAGRLQQLARAMPHACRALSADASQPPSTPAVTALTGFVHKMVDSLARSALTARLTNPASAQRKGKARFDSLQDQWLHALRAPDGALEGDDDELASLAAQIREWRRPIELTAAAPVKLCFRLEEPVEPIALEPLSSPQSA